MNMFTATPQFDEEPSIHVDTACVNELEREYLIYDNDGKNSILERDMGKYVVRVCTFMYMNIM